MMKGKLISVCDVDDNPILAFSAASHTLDGHTVVTDIETTFFLELVQEMVDKDVEVFTAQVCVTVDGLNLEHSLLHLKDRNIKCASSEIVHSDDRRVGTIKTIGKCSGCRLINDTENVQTNDLTSIFGSLSLSIVEVGGGGDHCVADSKLIFKVIV